MYIGWLGWGEVRDSSDGGFMVHNNFESLLVVEVKSKQPLDKSLMEFKETVLGKIIEAFSLGGGYFKVPKKIMCYRCRWVEVSDLRRIPWIPLLNSSGFKKNVP